MSGRFRYVTAGAWRRVDLQQVIRDRYVVDPDEITVGPLSKNLGFVHVNAWAHQLRQNPAAIDVYKTKRRPNMSSLVLMPAIRTVG